MKRKYALFYKDEECGTEKFLHSFRWTGSMPNTGVYKCIFCGKVEKR
ncbi:MAG: hypothetical protein ACOC5T_09525 [Elusimicrobiota bacterium]